MSPKSVGAWNLVSPEAQDPRGQKHREVGMRQRGLAVAVM